MFLRSSIYIILIVFVSSVFQPYLNKVRIHFESRNHSQRSQENPTDVTDYTSDESNENTNDSICLQASDLKEYKGLTESRIGFFPSIIYSSIFHTPQERPPRI